MTQKFHSFILIFMDMICVFVLIEKLIRRPLPDNIQLAFQQIGVGALLFLMVFALYNDLVRIFN